MGLNEDLLHQIIESQARQDERLKRIEGDTNSVRVAVYGNGHIGLSEAMNTLASRMEELEEFQSGCPIFEVATYVEGARKRKEETEGNKSEFRKWRWGVYAAVLLLVIERLGSYVAGLLP